MGLLLSGAQDQVHLILPSSHSICAASTHLSHQLRSDHHCCCLQLAHVRHKSLRLADFASLHNGHILLAQRGNFRTACAIAPTMSPRVSLMTDVECMLTGINRALSPLGLLAQHVAWGKLYTQVMLAYALPLTEYHSSNSSKAG